MHRVSSPQQHGICGNYSILIPDSLYVLIRLKIEYHRYNDYLGKTVNVSHPLGFISKLLKIDTNKLKREESPAITLSKTHNDSFLDYGIDGDKEQICSIRIFKCN